MYGQDLTDIAMDSGSSRSQLSKPDTMRGYQVFVGIFYSPAYPYIMAHNYSLYRRFLSIIGIDSTFIRTGIKGSGKYGREKDEEGIKMHNTSIVFPSTIPIEFMMTLGNLNDSPEFDDAVSNIDSDILRESILTFDLCYYKLNRFMGLKDSGIMFVKEKCQLYYNKEICTFKDHKVPQWPRVKIGIHEGGWKTEGLHHRY